MSVIHLPRLSANASKLWNVIPLEIKKKLLANVYCGSCKTGVSIVEVTGEIVGKDLVLHGKCAVCGGDVARVIEGPNS